MDPVMARVFAAARAVPAPVKVGPGAELPLTARSAEVFQVKSAVGMAIHPAGDAPYLFGLHQCSHARAWTADDLRIFQEIGQRLAQALTSLLAEPRLRESEARYRGFMDNATDAFFLLNGNGIVEDVNRQACEALGFAREELIGSTPALFSPVAHPEMMDRAIAYIGAGGQVAMDTHHRRKDGSTFPVEVRSRRMDGDGRWWAVSIARDISERKAAEEALRASERRHRAYFDASNAGMVAIDASGRAVRVNDAWCAMTGYGRAELQGKPIAALVFPEDTPALLAQWAAMRSGRTDRFVGEQRYRRRDGTALWTLTHVVVVSRDGSGAPLACSAVVVDVTDRKRLEEHLQRAKKLEAIGQLAGGVAHDFNNLLTVINGYADFLHGFLPPHDPRHDAVVAIQDAGERAARLTAQLLAFSRKAIVAPRVLDLNGVIGATIKMLARLIGEDVTLVTQLRPDLAAVRADAGQIEQLVMNLAVNARDAMPKGGRLTISTDEIDVNEVAAEPWDGEALTPGRHVRLRVSDTGAGMTEEVRRRIFEPFFTTKGLGRGTGLGLASVYGIVRQARGSVSVESREGQGTTFTVLLPAIATPAPPALPGSP
jgi:PAS domain S-box-containing protein